VESYRRKEKGELAAIHNEGVKGKGVPVDGRKAYSIAVWPTSRFGRFIHMKEPRYVTVAAISCTGVLISP